MAGDDFCDEGPEFAGVVEFAQVAKLVDDDIVGQFLREERDLVIEIQVALSGTAAPSGLLIFDADLLELESVEFIEIFYPFDGEHKGNIFMLQIFFPIPFFETALFKALEIIQLAYYPAGLADNEFLGELNVHLVRQCDSQSAVMINGDAHSSRPLALFYYVFDLPFGEDYFFVHKAMGRDAMRTFGWNLRNIYDRGS